MTKIEQRERDYRHIRDLIYSNGDIRLITMLCVGFLERYLIDVISKQMRSVRVDARRMLFKRFIRHVGQRIDFAEAIGALPSESIDDLRILIEIRNHFAHHIDAIDCSHPTIAKLIDKFDVANRGLTAVNDDTRSTDSRRIALLTMLNNTLHSMNDHLR